MVRRSLSTLPHDNQSDFTQLESPLQKGREAMQATCLLLHREGSLTLVAGLVGSSNISIARRMNNLTVRGMGPMVPQIGQQPDPDHGIFGSGRAGARPQVGRDEGMRRPFKNEER